MRHKLSAFALALCGFALVIILWGAWVRISGSGDGCGVHWPLCEGTFLPESVFTTAQTAIEFFHRAKSGLFGLLVCLLFALSLRAKGLSSLEKRLAGAVLFFTIVEGLLGAGLVLFGLVGTDASTARAFMIALHLINTLFLLATLIAYVQCLSSSAPVTNLEVKKGDVLLAASFAVIASFGAIASLSATLFPVSSLFAGLQQDLAVGAPWFVTLRTAHPILATCLLILALRWAHDKNGAVITKALVVLVVTVGFGLFALVIVPRPAWMKLTHLFLADISVMLFVKAWITNQQQRITNIVQ